MLTPEQVIPFLPHHDPVVRRQAERYFDRPHDYGPLTADHYWQVVDAFGMAKGGRGLLVRLSELRDTESSYQRLMQALRERAAELEEIHLQQAVGDLDMDLLDAHAQELLNCEFILPHVREHLRQRMLLAAEPIEPIWERLMALGQSLGGNYAGSFDEREPRRLIEALARDPGRFVDRAMLVLDDPDASSDWREIFAVQFLGAARHEPAADALVARFAIDADVLRERVQDALSQIGTLSVVQKIEAFYPGKEWHVRLYADEPLARIKRPECETALLRLWEIEEADDLRVNILDGLCKLGSTARLDQSRAMIAEEPQHPELLGLAEALIAVAAMNGVGLPEEPYWRSLLARRDARAAKMTARFDALFAKELRGNWLRDGITLPARENDPDEDDAQDETDADLWDAPAMNNLAEEPIAPYRRPAPKVGRNDPCPCKSGKKYKKCCGK